MIDVSKLTKGDQITIPSDLGIDRVATVHHTFSEENIHYAVVCWRNHFGQPFYSVVDSYQIRSVVNAK